LKQLFLSTNPKKTRIATRNIGEGRTHPNALEHVDNVVDPVPLHAEAFGRFVQPDGLHVVAVVENHEAKSNRENLVRTEQNRTSKRT
jgi:hypothetical protein